MTRGMGQVRTPTAKMPGWPTLDRGCSPPGEQWEEMPVPGPSDGAQWGAPPLTQRKNGL